jgi:S-adenosyl-L-methionine hydrolase (adenosine-forming)
MHRLITLLTDFGLEDEYVGVMKGVILSRFPAARIVDLCHGIPPHDLHRAAYLLESSRAYFPAGTLHVIVVDPGVGTARRIVLMEADDQLLLAPDNGILTLPARKGFTAVYEVSCHEFFLPTVSRTFHGRDILAPVAAELAKGLAPDAVGPRLSREELVLLPLARAEVNPAGTAITGQVVAIDRFGNLLTNIHISDYQALAGDLPPASAAVRLGDHLITGLASSYGNVPAGGLLAIFNSRNYLEIAINKGNAARLTGVGEGEKIVVSCKF